MVKIVDTRYGSFELVEHDNLICRSLENYGEWAQNELEVISHFIQKNDHVLDVGAFIGTHTAVFSSLVGSEGKVYSFEPVEYIFNILSKNIQRNHFENTILFNVALGSRENIISTPIIDFNKTKNYGSFSLKEKYELKEQLSNNIKVEFIDKYDFKKVDFIKIDVEGMEYDVLRGGINTIQRYRPYIFSEANSLEDGIAVLNLSRDIHYKAYGVLTFAYCKNNFRKNQTNIFDEAQELGLLLIPEENIAKHAELFTIKHIPEIVKADDLGFMLNHKPQYPYEILSNSLLAKTFDIRGYHFVKAQQRNEELMSEKLNMKNVISEKVIEIDRYRDELYRVYTSCSWRYTALFRKIGSFIKRVLLIAHRPRMRLVIKRFYFLIPVRIRNSRTMEKLKNRFKNAELK
ncbi:MAG: FkbM family methyltransferase [Sedimentisphaerales bacterium]|nr:FkbM family methyltransferase [Sedimentisphaerales bacterium]